MSRFGSGYPEPTDVELADDAAHVATFEAAIVMLAARYTAHQDRWDAALVKARLEFAKQRVRRPPKIVLG